MVVVAEMHTLKHWHLRAAVVVGSNLACSCHAGQARQERWPEDASHLTAVYLTDRTNSIYSIYLHPFISRLENAYYLISYTSFSQVKLPGRDSSTDPCPHEGPPLSVCVSAPSQTGGLCAALSGQLI